MDKKIFKKNEIIYRQGDIRSSMFRIESGRVAIYIDYQTDTEVMVAEITKGMAFGEMEMMEALPRTATAIAIEDDTKLNEITFAEFADVFRDEPKVVMDVLSSISSRTMTMVEEYIKINNTVKKLHAQKEQGEQQEHDFSFFNGIKKYIHDYIKIQNMTKPYEMEITSLL